MLSSSCLPDRAKMEVGFILLFFCTFTSAQLSIEFFTDPPGPTFQAASWIRFACQAEGDLGTFSYMWRVICSRTGNIEMTIDDPLLDEEGFAVIWVQSTPTSCLDYLECGVTDGDGNNGTIGRLIAGVTGIGLSIPSHSLEIVENNSAIIIPNDGRNIPNLLCHSALREIDSGRWIGPDGKQVFSTEQSERSGYAYLGLPLEDLSDEGVYSCVVPDENGKEQSLYVGIYSSVTTSQILLEYSFGPDSLSLNCITTGLPATATMWSKEHILIDLNGTDGAYTTLQMLTDTHSAVYSNVLSRQADRSQVHGEYTCDVYSDWIIADYSNSRRELMSGQFVFQTLGNTTSLHCAFPEDITQVAWYREDVLLVGNRSNAISLELKVSDSLHDNDFICHGTDSDGIVHVMRTKLIIYVPDDVISVVIKEDKPSNKTLNISCCVIDHTGGLSSRPIPDWIGPDGDEVVSSPGLTVTDTSMELEACCSLYFSSIRESHQGEYTCMAEVFSPALDRPLVKSEGYRLQMQYQDDDEEDTGQAGSNGSDEKGSDEKGSDEKGSDEKVTTAIVAASSAAGLVLLVVAAFSFVAAGIFLKQRKSKTNADDTT